MTMHVQRAFTYRPIINAFKTNKQPLPPYIGGLSNRSHCVLREIQTTSLYVIEVNFSVQRRLVASFSPRKPGFDSGRVHAGSGVDIISIGFFPASIILLMLYQRLS